MQHLLESRMSLYSWWKSLCWLKNSVVFGYAESVLSYGIIIWDSSWKLTQVLQLQKRIIQNNETNVYPDSKQIFKELQILPCIYILETVNFIHQNLKLFEINLKFNEKNTRASCNLHQIYHRLTASLNDVSHRGTIWYNKLPKCIKELNNKKFIKH